MSRHSCQLLIFQILRDFSFESRSNCRDVLSQVWKCVFSFGFFFQGPVWVGSAFWFFICWIFLSNPDQIVETYYRRYGSAFFLLDFFFKALYGSDPRFGFLFAGFFF